MLSEFRGLTCVPRACTFPGGGGRASRTGHWAHSSSRGGSALQGPGPLDAALSPGPACHDQKKEPCILTARCQARPRDPGTNKRHRTWGSWGCAEGVGDLPHGAERDPTPGRPGLFERPGRVQRARLRGAAAVREGFLEELTPPSVISLSQAAHLAPGTTEPQPRAGVREPGGGVVHPGPQVGVWYPRHPGWWRAVASGAFDVSCIGLLGPP